MSESNNEKPDVPQTPPFRLPSFRQPRDLTLSSTANNSVVRPTVTTRSRKIFVPNIPVKREKGIVNNNMREHVSEQKKTRGNSAGRGRGDGKRPQKEFLQLTGSLFGSGVAASSVVSQKGGMNANCGGVSFGKGGGGKSKGGTDMGYGNSKLMSLGGGNIISNHIDKEEEDQKLKELLQDSFISDMRKFTYEKNWDESVPVHLPVSFATNLFCEERKPDIVTDGKSHIATCVKVEPVENNVKLDVINGTAISKPEENNVSKSILKHIAGQDFLFMQLPNCLPSSCRGIKEESNVVGDNAKSDDKKDMSSGGTFELMPEGRIGTLKLYKSGRMKLCLNNHTLIICDGTEVGFLQDGVSVDIDDENKIGSMCVLGHIGKRLVCSPHFERLVQRY